MTLDQVHLEIAKERYLELLATHAGSERKLAAAIAIQDADDFVAGYTIFGRNQGKAAGETKGCKVCFGSGGKSRAPCKECGGTGRVPA